MVFGSTSISSSVGRGAGPVAAALVLVDVQREFVDPKARFSIDGYSGFESPDLYREYLDRVNALAANFRGRGLSVFHLRSEVRSDYLDSAFAPVWRASGFSAEGGLLVSGSWGVDFPPELAVAPEDFVLTKKGHSAFGGTSLDRTLQSLGIDRILLAGGAIGGCLTDTAYDGAALGYQLALVRDAAYPLQRVESLASDPTVDVVTAAELLDGTGWWSQPPVTGPDCAVIVADSDPRVLGNNGVARRAGASIDHIAFVADRVDQVVSQAEGRGWPVIPVATVIPDVTFSAFPRTPEGRRETEYFVAAGIPGGYCDGLTMLTKTGPSVFAGTSLDRTLRNLRVRKVVLAGGDCRAGQSVIASVRDAAALGYEVLVIGDTTYPMATTTLDDADRRCRVVDSGVWQKAITTTAQVPVAASTHHPQPTQMTWRTQNDGNTTPYRLR